MKTLIRILIAIALTILILHQANAQTYQGTPIKFDNDRWNITATVDKEFTPAEAEQFFNFIDKVFGRSLKDRYLITRSQKVYYRPGIRLFKRVVTIKSKLPSYGRRPT